MIQYKTYIITFWSLLTSSSAPLVPCPKNSSYLAPLLLLFSLWLSGTSWTVPHQALPFYAISWSLLKFMSIESVMSSNHLILCHSLLLPPSAFPSIWVFSDEPVLCIRWPKYWSFSFSTSPSSEYSGESLPENKTNEEQNRAEMKRNQTLLTLECLEPVIPKVVI